jgi:DNA-binding LacI/PurR family transcriptional regulator
MVGIADIARDVGVSMSLVSKVLSGRMGKSSVRPELAQRIHVRSKQLGYVPNSTARALVKRRQNVIGVFFHQYGQPGSGLVETVVCAISNALSKENQSLLLKFFSTEAEFAACLETAHRSVMDGVILVGARLFEGSPAVARLATRELPVASMTTLPLFPGASSVGIDPVEVGRTAALHLLDAGCRRIVHFRISPESKRALGCRQAHEERGVAMDPRLALTTPGYDSDAIPRLVGKLLKAKIPFDGVIATSDAQAAVVTRLLLDQGLRVPRDVKVIGVDNAPFCPYCSVPLSSVSGQDDERAALAVRILLKQIAGAPAQNRTLPPVVVARESTAASPRTRKART